MEKDKKKPLFIHQPEYKGGPKALTQFIYAHLRYPAAALEPGVEGMVLVDYDIDYKGNVVATRVLQGVGHGCDEEACRVVRLLKFDVPKNRGVRVLFHKKARIQFKKPAPVAQLAAPDSPSAALQVSYSLTPVETPAETVAENKKEVYSYTIQL